MLNFQKDAAVSIFVGVTVDDRSLFQQCKWLPLKFCCFILPFYLSVAFSPLCLFLFPLSSLHSSFPLSSFFSPFSLSLPPSSLPSHSMLRCPHERSLSVSTAPPKSPSGMTRNTTRRGTNASTSLPDSLEECLSRQSSSVLILSSIKQMSHLSSSHTQIWENCDVCRVELLIIALKGILG